MLLSTFHLSRTGLVLPFLALSLALAGCETVNRASGGNVAEFVDDKSGAQATNISSLSDVVASNPNDPNAYNTRGAAYARVGRFQDAITDFSKAVQLNPGYAAAYTNRALAYRQIGKNQEAMADFTKAIQSDPNYGPAYLGRANLYRALDAYNEAF
jgi:tetratricopeptide (TPR) repeat protein